MARPNPKSTVSRAATSSQLVVRGAREHNLKNVDLAIPRDALVTFTGVSGSGKSSLAFHTIYQEGQRRFLESLSSYARQFLGRMEKPKVDHVEGLSPTVSIDQKSGSHSPRSTVGTLTETLDFLRLLYARLGTPACPVCGTAIETWARERIVDAIAANYAGRLVHVMAPVVRERKGEYRKELADWRQRGFVRARVDGTVRRLDEKIELHRYKYHTIELVIDRLEVTAAERPRLAEAIEQALALGDGLTTILAGDEVRAFSTQRACPAGHGSLPELEPRTFSFNSPLGACASCDGLGERSAFRADLIVRDPALPVRELPVFTKAGRLLYSHYTLAHVDTVLRAFGGAIDSPWRQLPKPAQQALLFGSGERSFEFRWERGGEVFRTEGRERRPFPGVLPHFTICYGGATKTALDRFRAAAVCPDCQGTRLGPAGRNVRFRGRTLPEVVAGTVDEVLAFLQGLQLSGNEIAIGRDLVREIAQRLGFLVETGLGYVTLDRRADTLSGGESQRIRLAAAVGAGLRGILYVLDEPSIGLHPRDQQRLIRSLQALRDRGNTVCVVEHDHETMLASDWLVDIGPLAGVHGGEIVASGPPAEVARSSHSVTGRYLRGELRIPVPAQRRAADRGALVVRGASHHNLRDLTVRFPLGRLIVVTGVSGSGKSTLVSDVLDKALRRALLGSDDVPGRHEGIDGLELVDKVIEVDQAPIGRTPRSNPATYTGVWDHVRDLFAALPESRVRQYQKGRFSFNVKGGRCEVCEGAGVKTLEMQFLAPVEVPCEECNGARFHADTLEIRFKDQSVRDVLEMTIEEAREFFAAFPKLERGLATLCEVGLGYLQLGQPSTTLSGGEAQRIKLATELQRVATGRTVYLLDEPTTGLHPADIERLLVCLHRLVDASNTVVVIEHNLDVIRSADWLIDLGPEGGAGGGRLVAEGTPEDLAKVAHSHTGAALRGELRPGPSAAAGTGTAGGAPTEIRIRGARTNNLQNVDVDLPLGRYSVVTGVSGSGKSSLAFDTLFREGQRRFLESMSTYARRFLGRLDKAPVDRIDGLGPAIAIDQENSSKSPRSTVATTTEIHDYLRLLYARIGRPHCPEHGHELEAWTPIKIAQWARGEFAPAKGYVLAPIAGGERTALRARWRELGFVRALVGGKEHRLEEPLPAAGELALVIDRMDFSERTRLVDAVEQAFRMGGGFAVLRTQTGRERRFAEGRSCPECGFAFPSDPHPRLFSFNHHQGACAHCGGLGEQIACDEKLLVNHPDEPLFRGGISHQGAWCTFLTKPDGWWGAVAAAVAARHGFSVEVPYAELDAKARRILMRGLGAERVEVVFRSERPGSSRTYRMQVQWKGLCTQVEEWCAKHEGGEGRARYAAVMRAMPCAQCAGERLGPAQRRVLVGGVSLPAFARLTVEAAQAQLRALALGKSERTIAHEILREIGNRLSFLSSVGLGYLTLDRSAATLSGGEAQRIRLATQLGNRLVGVLYVLDEPTVGLHARDTERLLRTLLELRDLGNTIVAVEHDPQMIRAADWVVDLGPGAGQHGGRVVAVGPPDAVAAAPTLTGRGLRGEIMPALPRARRSPLGTIALRKVQMHNLKGLDVDFPLGVFTAVTGVSGSGKSTLVLDVLLPLLRSGKARLSGIRRAHAIVVDQSPIGASPASNPATYVGAFDAIRQLFAQLPQARAQGYKAGRFSFNVAGGRCEACEGKGSIQVEMHFLADVWIGCEVCRGRRYEPGTLAVQYRNQSIADVLALEAAAALDLFANHPKIARPLRLLCDVGLGYLQLGRAANTLSGGEAQRIKLVAELARPGKEHNVYLLDEPTTGLHLDDVAKLIAVLQRLVERGDTVIAVEHHLDVIAAADHVLELGPEAGDAGGEIVAAGPPERIAKTARSATGRYLAPLLRHRAPVSSGTAEAGG